MALAVVNCGKPVIAAIEGVCFGGGFELALACDFRVASEKSKIGMPEIQRGLFPGTGGIRLLARVAGIAVARRVVYSGDVFSGRELNELGAIERISDDGEALNTAMKWAEELATRPAMALQAARRLLDSEFSEQFRNYLEQELEEYVDGYQTEDSVEGRESFLSKRAPVWKHR
jgi:enoyl-CoA hydratase/carnithine racemase